MRLFKPILLTLSVFIFLLSNSNGYSQNGEKIDQSSCTFNSEYLDSLIRNDSLYEATVLLNEAISFTKANNLKASEAKALDKFGEVLSAMGNYKNAESYYKRAFFIYDSLQLNKEKDIVLAGLAKAYADGKFFKKFDSLYPIASKLSKQLNSELQFINLENKIKKHYFNYENDSLLKTTNDAIDRLNSVNFEGLNFSKDYHSPNLKDQLRLYYMHHKAIARVKLNKFNRDGFDLLLKIDENDLKTSLLNENDNKRKLATFNYYKYLYFRDIEKSLDSANKYLLKSDTYKYNALKDLEDRNMKNGELLYKIITTEQQLNVTEKTRQNEAKLSRIYLITTIITSIMLVICLFTFYSYFKAKRNINSINQELKDTNNKLIEIDKERLEFFSILSHELRTPIYGISGLATLIKQEDDKLKKQSYLNSLISSSNYISILIDNVLQATKLRFDDKSLRLKPDKIKNLIKNVTSTVEIAAKNKGLKFITVIEDSNDDEFIMLDKVALSQILINLAYNGIRYTKKGSVTINVREKSRTEDNVTLLFEVTDTGIGIAKEHRSLVFNAFENKNFLDQNSRGSGLGLYIVKTLLKSHDATIDFISEQGIGTVFFFESTFQIAKKNDKDSSSLVHTTNAKSHILIVDDNKINLLITQKNIERIEGHSCETIANGRQSISMVKHKNFDMILMDINMPDMDGFEVTKHIRMFNPNIPIIALTALNSNEIEDKANKAGINRVITKPYNFEDFRDIILSYSR